MPKVPVLGVTVDQLAQILRTRLEDARARALGAPAAFKPSTDRDSDETEGRRLYRAAAEAVARADLARARHRVALLAERQA